MRRMIGALAVVMMMAAGACVARAQDAAAAAMQASQQAMQMSLQASQQAQMNMQMAQQAAMNNDYYGAPPRPPLPMTPMPMITPGGGRFKGSVQVAIVDADSQAIVFYTTDGSVPTLSSRRYVGPIVVSAKGKVRALAFDLNRMPSGVVSKTFRVKTS